MDAFGHQFEVVSQPASLRKRGRPPGKARTPLSLEERRARNAHYERERRHAMAAALEELARAADLDPGMSTQDLLAEVVNFLHMASQKKNAWDADALRRCNNNLASQIATLEHRIATEPELQGCVSPPSPLQEPCIQKRKREYCESPWPPSKRLEVDQRISPLCSGVQSHPPGQFPPLGGDLKEEVTFPDGALSLPTHQLPCSEPVCQYKSATWGTTQLEEPTTHVSWEWFSGVSTSPANVKAEACEDLWTEILNASASSPRVGNDRSTVNVMPSEVDDLFLNYFLH